MEWCLSFHNKVQFHLAKGSTSTRLNFGMCQNVKPEGPFCMFMLLLQTCIMPAVQSVPSA